MICLEQFTNLAQTILAGNIAAGATTLTVNNAAPFPANGQFRIIIDQEIFLVTNVSGNNFTVVPGYESTTQSVHNAGASVTHIMTAGLAAQLYNHALGRINFYEYSPGSIHITTDLTTTLQNFLLHCQLVALNLKSSGLDDQAQRVFVTAYLPRGYYGISCPLIVPENVNLHCDGVIVRNGSVGTITANYTGDTTSQALANLYMPTVIIVPRAHCTTINLYSNNDGIHLGAGMACGKTWAMQSVTVSSAGTGYHVGDVIACAQPSLNPYIAATATVSAVSGSGGITSITLNNPGAYALPPVLQQLQWTSANGFNVFDASGNFLTSGGNGSGATLAATWVPDWVSGDATYQMGQGGLVADTLLKHLRIMHVDTTNDNTYGPMNALALHGLNYAIEDVELQGGRNGVYCAFAADIRASKFNMVDSVNALLLTGCSNVVITEVVVDTPSGVALYIDQSQGITLRGRIFNRNLFNYSGSDNYTIRVGYNSSSGAGLDVEGLVLDFQLTNAGSGGTPLGNPALYLAYLKGSRIDLTITNYTTSQGVAPITSYATFGADVDASNELRGSLDQASGALFGGTVPLCSMRIWDAVAGGYAGPGGVYELYGSGAPTNGTSGTGVNKAATASLYTDTVNAVRYINTGTAASPTWNAFTTA